MKLYTKISIGLMFANIFKPGAGLDENVKTQLLQNYEQTTQEQLVKAKPKVTDVLLKIIPTSPIRAMADGDMLGLIFFSLASGIALTYLPASRAESLIKVFDGLNEAIIQLVHPIMKVAPYGIFALIAEDR